MHQSFKMFPNSRSSFLWPSLLFANWWCSLVSSTECSCETDNISHPGCGIIPSISTIYNGRPASYPWMVFLFSAPENGQQSFCGGSLISDLQVVTAAHCVAGKTTDDVAVLLADKNAQEKLNKMDFHFLYKIEIYPAYNLAMNHAYRYNSDIAVLTLEKPVLLSEKVNTICLPSFSESRETHEGTNATVTGWGLTEKGVASTDQLLSVEVPIISNTQCRKSYQWIRRQIVMNELPYLYIFHSVFTFAHTRKGLVIARGILVDR